MVGKTQPIGVADERRFKLIWKYSGCLPCLLMGHPDVHTTIEHVTDRGRRLAEQHKSTIGLCLWHHFGQTKGDPARIRAELGPSLADGRTVFEAVFGDEVKVLLPCQDLILKEHDLNPWPEYAISRKVAKEVRRYWEILNG